MRKGSASRDYNDLHRLAQRPLLDWAVHIGQQQFLVDHGPKRSCTLKSYLQVHQPDDSPIPLKTGSHARYDNLRVLQTC